MNLILDRVSVSFGRLSALEKVSFTVAPGERVGLLGANGAGKTTLLDVITGLTRPGSGAGCCWGITRPTSPSAAPIWQASSPGRTPAPSSARWSG